MLDLIVVVTLLAIRKVLHLHFHSKQSARTPKKNSTVVKSGVPKQANIKDIFQLMKRPCEKDN